MSDEAGAPVVPVSDPMQPPYGYGEQPPPRSSSGSRVWLWLVLALFFFACLIGSTLWAFSLFTSDSGGVASVRSGSVAVIPIYGTIQGTGGTFDGVATPQSVVSKLQRAENDPFVKAIVLRIESPGGTVAASEEIAAEVAECPKPVVASIGDVGASGAYMVASQCDSIVAMQGSSVGSIGVILQIPNVAELFDNIGVKVTTLTSGEYKDAGSPYRDLTEEEKQRLQGQIDEVYYQFIDIVAEGRDLPRSEVESLATGWVWTGAEARELGLIDEIGTQNDAIGIAGDLGGIDGEPGVVTYEEPPFSDLLSSLFGLSSKLDAIGGVLEGTEPAGTALPR
jgi:protease-4